MTQSDLTACFEYLDGLRESGRVNMWGAAPFLQRARKINQADARRICNQWRETFDEKQTAQARAAQVTP